MSCRSVYISMSQVTHDSPCNALQLPCIPFPEWRPRKTSAFHPSRTQHSQPDPAFSGSCGSAAACLSSATLLSGAAGLETKSGWKGYLYLYMNLRGGVAILRISRGPVRRPGLASVSRLVDRRAHARIPKLYLPAFVLPNWHSTRAQLHGSSSRLSAGSCLAVPDALQERVALQVATAKRRLQPHKESRNLPCFCKCVRAYTPVVISSHGGRRIAARSSARRSPAFTAPGECSVSFQASESSGPPGCAKFDSPIPPLTDWTSRTS